MRESLTILDGLDERTRQIDDRTGRIENEVTQLGPQVTECFSLLGQNNSAAVKNALDALRRVRIADPERVMECRDEFGKPIHCPPYRFPAQLDHLFRNDGDGTFTDVSRAAGIEIPDIATRRRKSIPDLPFKLMSRTRQAAP